MRAVTVIIKRIKVLAIIVATIMICSSSNLNSNRQDGARFSSSLVGDEHIFLCVQQGSCAVSTHLHEKRFCCCLALLRVFGCCGFDLDPLPVL